MKRYWILTIISFLIFLIANGCGSGGGGGDAPIVSSGPGTLDSTFGVKGIAANNGVAEGKEIYLGIDVALDSNGKILVAGCGRDIIHYDSYDLTDETMVIWRHNLDGTLDTTFGTNGIVISDGVTGVHDSASGYAIALGSNGKIFVTGHCRNISNGPLEMIIWKFNTDGTPDTSFGDDGIVTSGGNDSDRGNAIAIDSNGKILVVGFRHDASGKMAIWKYNADGTPDTSFGTDGIVTSDNVAGGGPDEGFSIALNEEGEIFVAGWAGRIPGPFSPGSEDNFDMAIWKYNSDGTPDTDFGTNGSVISNDTIGPDAGYAMALDDEGNIFVTGYVSSSPSSGINMVIWKYNEDGTPDTAFGDNGKAVVNNPAGGNVDGAGSAIIFDASGKILVSGSFTVRYNMDGTPDTSFGTNGIAVSDLALEGGYRYGYSLRVDTQGRILVGGEYNSNSESKDMAIWRYNP